MKVKKIINSIGMLLIIITIVIFNLIVGGNEKSLPILPMCIILCFSFVILLIKKIKYKEKLIKSKIDIAISIFMAILFLPLIFNTYCSFEGTIEFILKYLFVYNMYLLTRNIVDTKKKYNILIATTVISSLIIIILGIDLQHAKHFDLLLQKLDLKYTNDYRFSSTFGYANGVSIYVLFCIFLSINRIENSDKVLPKIFYFIYIALGSYIIYISYSRVVLILYGISIGAYLVIKLYNKIKNNKELIKKILFIVIILFGLLLIYLIITIRIPKPYYPNGSFKLRKEIKPNQEYIFEFDIDVTTGEKDTTSPQLVILEVNKYFNEEEIGRIILNPKKNKHFAIVKTSEDVEYIKIQLINGLNKTITINHCYIDDEEYIFSHKYIPNIISRLIRTFSIKDDSIILRKHFYENSLRIAKDSPIIGHGGNTWKRLSVAYADFPYAVKETHSYFFELLISYGLIGVVSFLTIIILFTKDTINNIKNCSEKRKQILTVFIALMLMFLYNFIFDFGMSFIVIILATFQFIALLQIDSEEDINIKYIDIVSLIIIGLVLTTLTCSCIAKYFIKDVKIKAKFAPYVVNYNAKALDKNNLDDIKRFISKDPYRKQNDMYKLYWNTLYEKRNEIPYDELQDYIDFGIKTFETIKCTSAVKFNTLFDRIYIMIDAVEKLEEIENTEESVKRLKEQIKKEYETNKEYIKDINRNHKSKTESENKLNEYKTCLGKIQIEVD